MPTIALEQPVYAVFQAFWQVISSPDFDRRDDEIALALRMTIDLRVAFDREVFSCAEIPYASFSGEVFCVELFTLHP